MATPIVVGKTDKKLRKEIAQVALCEVNFLMGTLDREHEAAETGDVDADCGFPTLWRTLTKRIDELNCAALNALDTGTESTDHLLDVLYGEGGWTREEAAHEG
jgi:hypothetical protein